MRYGTTISLALQAILSAVAFAGVFVAASLVWRFKFAMCFALVTVLGGLAGAALGVLLQVPFSLMTLHGVEPLLTGLQPPRVWGFDSYRSMENGPMSAQTDFAASSMRLQAMSK
jgi:hypothetical protein